MPALYQNRNSDLYCRDSRFASKTMGFISHLHYHIELGFVFEGHTRVTVDSKTYDVVGGDIIVVFPNQIHQFETVEREKYVLLIVNPDILSELTSVFTSSTPVSNLIKGCANDPEMKDIIRKIADTYYGDEPYKDTLLRGYLLIFFGKLLSRIEIRDLQSRDYNVLGVIMNYCTANSDKELSLGILERELHISKYYISHLMSNKLKMGFNDYVNSLRISNACKQLIKSDASITEISENVGFNTLRTFNRAFMKQTGMTPSEYRREKKKIKESKK